MQHSGPPADQSAPPLAEIPSAASTRAAVSAPATRLPGVGERGSQLGAAETPRRATSSSGEDTVRVGVARSVLTTSLRAASGSSPKATVRRNSPPYRPDSRLRVKGSTAKPRATSPLLVRSSHHQRADLHPSVAAFGQMGSHGGDVLGGYSVAEALASPAPSEQRKESSRRGSYSPAIGSNGGGATAATIRVMNSSAISRSHVRSRVCSTHAAPQEVADCRVERRSCSHRTT